MNDNNPLELGEKMELERNAPEVADKCDDSYDVDGSSSLRTPAACNASHDVNSAEEGLCAALPVFPEPEESELADSVASGVDATPQVLLQHSLPDYGDLVDVAAVRLGRLGPASFFVAGKVPCAAGDKIIVEVEEGLAFGEVVTVARMNPQHLAVREPKDTGEMRGPSDGVVRNVVRRADEKDCATAAENAELASDAMKYCQICINERHLDMKLVDVLVLLNRSKMVFYFAAPSRIDFRELVKDLVRSYRTRIELRQIGVRHETQMVGAVGNCGMVCCCRRYLRTFAPVAIKMAKEQNVFLNPVKISGICGRLLCCLAYEQEHYDEFYKRCPKLGKKYQTDAGPMRVLRASMFRESVNVLNENNEEIEYALEAWNALSPHRPNAPLPGPQTKGQKNMGQKQRPPQEKKTCDEAVFGERETEPSAPREARGYTPASVLVVQESGIQEADAATSGYAGTPVSPVAGQARVQVAPPVAGADSLLAERFPLDDTDDNTEDDGDSIFGLAPQRTPKSDTVRQNTGVAAGGDENNKQHKHSRQRYGRRKPRHARQQ